MQVRVSTDGGETQSEQSLSLSLTSKLPRLLSLQHPRKLFSALNTDLLFSGLNLDAFGAHPSLSLQMADGTSTSNNQIQLIEGTCTSSSGGTVLTCSSVQIPECNLNSSCRIKMVLVPPGSLDEGGKISQAFELTVYPQPEIQKLYPSGGDSATASVQLLTSHSHVLLSLIESDTNDSCCLDGACAFRCLTVCRIHSKGRGQYRDFRAAIDANGQISCSLPSYGASAPIQCSLDVPLLEVQLIIDDYFVLYSHDPFFHCYMDTAISAPTV